MSGHTCNRCRGGIPADELLMTPRGVWHESCYIATINDLRVRGVTPVERSN